MTAKSKADLTTQINIIRNETVAGANTRGRVATALQDITDSTWLVDASGNPIRTINLGSTTPDASGRVAARGLTNGLTPERPAGPELEDHFGSDLLRQWRCDQEHWSVTDGVVTYVDDRVTKRVVSRLAMGAGPNAEFASPVFNYRNALNFGTAERHTKRLYSTDANSSATNPFIQVAVWSHTATPTQNNLLLGNGDATSYSWHGFGAAGGAVAWPNALLSTEETLPDWSSRLAHCSIIGIFDSGVRSRGLIIRADGKMWHTQDFTGCAATAGQASGLPCVGNSGTSSAYGFPGMVADYALIQGRVLEQRDTAAILEYLRVNYAFALPRREVLLDGNSLNAACASRFRGSALPNTDTRYFAAVSSRSITHVIGALHQTANLRSCCVSGMDKIYVGNEIINSIIGRESSASIKAELTKLFSLLRRYGYTKIIYGTCMDYTALNAGQQVIRGDVNAWLVTQLANGTIDELVNLHTADAIDGQSCPAELLDPSNTTYFLDGLHLTSAGYDIYWAQWLARILSAGG